MKQSNVRVSPTEDILNEDERRIFIPAVGNLRIHGFGEVTLFFRNGLVYRVKVVIDDYNMSKANKSGGKKP